MISERKNSIPGIGVAMIMILIIASLFILNFIIPLRISPLPFDHFSNFSSRIWLWLEYAVGIAAVACIIRCRAYIIKRDLVLAVVLACLNWIGRYTMNGDLYDATPESVITALAFIAAVIIFRMFDRGHILKVEAFAGGPSDMLKGIIYGITFAIPFALVNTAYFWFSSGPGHPGNVIKSFMMALHAGISEEIIFRYFIIALCLLLLHSRLNQKMLVATTLFLAIVPHSLAHLPDILLSNPGSGIVLLLISSILFGLPMALLQIKKNLEAAISFHWFIDFIRFLCGY